MSKERSIKPTELGLGKTAWFINEDYVDNDDQISRSLWYDPVEFKVQSTLKMSGNEVIVDEGTRNELRFPADEKCIFLNGEAALSYCYQLNSEEKEKNDSAVANKRKEVEELEDKLDRAKNQLEKGKAVSKFFNDWLDKTASGEIYQNTTDH